MERADGQAVQAVGEVHGIEATTIKMPKGT